MVKTKYWRTPQTTDWQEEVDAFEEATFLSVQQDENKETTEIISSSSLIVMFELHCATSEFNTCLYEQDFWHHN